MTRIGIIGGGVAGLHLGLYTALAIATTIYTSKTAAQHRADRLRNVVAPQWRDATTRAGARSASLGRSGAGPRRACRIRTRSSPIAFAGR